MTGTDWHALASSVEYPTQLFIDGAWTESLGGGRVPVVSPIDGRTVAEVAFADEADVDRAVAAARRAFDDGRWSRLAPSPARTS